MDNRDLISTVLEKYGDSKIDIVDIYLHYLAEEEGYEIMSFDHDFKKLK